MAAKTVNIRQDVRGSDSFYRYKMPQLLTKIEGKGNGIKTVLPNISEVARALSRPPTYPTKFFGCELGAQTMFDDKADRYIVNGAHDASRLRELLDSFIEKFVLCQSCKNPETDLILTRDDIVLRDCKACGVRSSVDMRHKLITFIIKNPPTPKPKKGAKKTATAPNGEAAVEGSGADADGGNQSDDDLTRRIREGAKDLESNLAVNGLNRDETTEEWSTETSKNAVASRLEALQGGIQTTLILDEDDTDDKSYNAFGNWLCENRSATDAEVFKHAQDLGIERKHKATQVLAQSLFTEDIVKEIGERTALLRKMVTSEKHEKALLGGLEFLVGETRADLIAQVPKILMALYQSEIVEEEAIKHFAGHASSKYVDKTTSKQVRRAAKPFIAWLEAADSEDEE